MNYGCVEGGREGGPGGRKGEQRREGGREGRRLPLSSASLPSSPCSHQQESCSALVDVLKVVHVHLQPESCCTSLVDLLAC